MPCRPRSSAKESRFTVGCAVIHTVTGPTAAAHAVWTARSIKRACNKAARSGPRAGIRRVLAKPGVGALARMAIATGSLITIAAGERLWIGSEQIGDAQAPHEHDRRK